MRTFNFKIIVSDDVSLNLKSEHGFENFANAAYEAGCDDALVSLQCGQVIVTFDRESDTLEQAIISAVADVRKTGASIDSIELEPPAENATTF